MDPGRDSRRDRDATCYELRLAGHLDQRWSTWFEGLLLIHEADGTTTLRGEVAVQAALHGLLCRIRDLGITLLAVEATTPPQRREA